MNPLRHLLLFGSVLLLTLAGLDAYLQLAGIQTPMETQIDPVLGPTYIPGKFICRFNEGFFMGAVNRFGYLGPAIPPRRRGPERRILLLGDSYVLGHTVFPRHHFGRYLEEDLGRTLGQDVRALNFGKADFNFGDMYQYHRDFAGAFDHDLALFIVSETNLVPPPQIGASLYPKVRLRGDSLVIDRAFLASGTYRFYKAIEPVFTRSAVLRLVFNTYKAIQTNRWRVVVALDHATTCFRPRRDAPPPKPPRELPALSLAILHELSRDPRNVLVIWTALPPGLLAEVRACRVPIVDLSACLEEQKARGNDPQYWPVTGVRGHWNHATHPVIGRVLAGQILARGLVRADPTAPRRLP